MNDIQNRFPKWNMQVTPTTSVTYGLEPASRDTFGKQPCAASCAGNCTRATITRACEIYHRAVQPTAYMTVLFEAAPQP